MQELALEVQLREERGKQKTKALRREGFIPAVIYGAGKKCQSIQLNCREFLRLTHEHHLESTIFNLNIKGDKAHTVLVKEMQYHPVNDDIIHIDFQEISLTSEIKVNIGVVPKGESVGVKQEGGVLNHLLWELEIECLPTKIPEEIKVDISQMNIGDSIHVRDLSLPEGVKIINEPDAVVFSVEPPMKEEEAPLAAEGEEPAELEVIKEKKEVPEESQKEEKQA